MCNQKEVPKGIYREAGEMEMINDHEVRVPMGIKIDLEPRCQVFDSNWAAQVEEAMRLEALAKTFGSLRSP